MFDISLEPWIICILVGIIILRPDDWHEGAFIVGKWIRFIRAYFLQWQEHLGYPFHTPQPSKHAQTLHAQSRCSGTYLMTLCLYKIGSKEFYISVQPQKS
jgi:hypothetical protein